MNTSKFNFKKIIAVGSTSVFTLLAVPMAADIAFSDGSVFLTAAHAAGEETTDGIKGGASGSGEGATGGAGKGGSSGTHGGTDKGAGATSAGATDAGKTDSGQSGGASTSGSQGSASSGAGKGSGAAGTSAGNSGVGQGGKPSTASGSSAVTTTEEDGGKGQMGSGVHGQGSYQDSKQKGGAASPGPGGINSEPNDAKGPRFSGGAGTGSSGGKPVWAQEGLPTNSDGSEVELGRLNVARAPGKLLDKQLVEALSGLAAIVASPGDSIYTVDTLEKAIALIMTDSVRIDSPLANLALLKDFLTDGVIDGDYVTADGTTYEVLNPNMTDAQFVSLLLGSAADKTVTITEGTVGAMETLLGVDLGDNADIADMADAVRQAILDAHED